MCFLWPCPRCYKAAKKRYKTKLEQNHRKQEEKKKKKKKTLGRTPANPSLNLVQLSNMDHNPSYINWHHFVHNVNSCDCARCREIRKQEKRNGKAPPKPTTGSVDHALANFGFHTGPPPGLRHLHLHGAAGIPPYFGAPPENPSHPPPQAMSRQQHLPGPPPVFNSVPTVYIWPDGVSQLSFPIVDYTVGDSFAEMARTPPSHPDFYMATLPETADVSDLIMSLAPAGSCKTLMARSRKDGKFFTVASWAGCVTSLKRKTLQLEIWDEEDIGRRSSGKRERVASTSSAAAGIATQAATRKKNKGKKTARIHSPEVPDDDDDDEEDLQSSAADGGDDDDDDAGETTD